MALLKRATKKLQDAGYNLEVHKGLWGYYVFDPNIKERQSSRVYLTLEECLRDVLENGALPRGEGEQDEIRR